MSKFGDYLKARIVVSGETVSSVARSCNIERTLLHKAMSGDRTLPYPALKSLASHFNMTIDERQEFFRLYDLHLQGEEAYENRQAVCDFLNNLSAIRFVMPPPPEVGAIPMVNQLIRGEYAVHSAIRSVLIYETAHVPKAEFMLFVPDRLDITMELMELWLNGRSFHVTELLSLRAMQSESRRQNLKKLGSVIPLCLASRGSYRPYYFTESVGAIAVSPMYRYIVTPHYLITLSDDLTTAQICDDRDLVAYYGGWFKTLIANFDPLIQCSANILEVLTEYIRGTAPDALQVIMSQPCPGRYFTPNVIRKYLNSGDMPYEEMFRLVEHHFSVLRQIKKNYLTIFTEKGLSDMIQTCTLQDLPPQYVPPLEKADLKAMLQSLYDEIESGAIRGIIVRPGQLKIPDYLSFYLSPQTGIHIYTTNAFVYGAYACDIHIAENTICKVFADFLQGLTGSPMAYSTEETLELLRRYIDQI